MIQKPLSSTRLVVSSGERLGLFFQTMKRESVKIWAGWLESIDNIPDRSSRAELALAIFEYALDGRDYSGGDPWVKVLLPTIKKTIDGSLQNAENGRRGGQRSAEVRNLALTAAPSVALSDPQTAAPNTKDVDDNDNIDYNDNNIEKKGITSNTPKKEGQKFSFKLSLIKEGVDEQVAADYMAVRNKHKAPSTVTAFNGLLREAQKVMLSTDLTLTDIVRICAERGWQGVKADWILKDYQGKPTAQAADDPNEQVRIWHKQIEEGRAARGEIKGQFNL